MVINAYSLVGGLLLQNRKVEKPYTPPPPAWPPHQGGEAESWAWASVINSYSLVWGLLQNRKVKNLTPSSAPCVTPTSRWGGSRLTSNTTSPLISCGRSVTTIRLVTTAPLLTSAHTLPLPHTSLPLPLLVVEGMRNPCLSLPLLGSMAWGPD